MGDHRAGRHVGDVMTIRAIREVVTVVFSVWTDDLVRPQSSWLERR